MICLESLKSSEFAIFLTNRGQKSVTMFISSCFNNYQLNFKISEKKLRPSGIRTRNPWGLRLQNTCTIECAKNCRKVIFLVSYIRQNG